MAPSEKTKLSSSGILGSIDGPANQWISVPEHQGSGDIGVLDIKRITDRGIGALMGKAWRNPITGQVQIKATGSFQDFCVADLWTRYGLHGTTTQLSEDPYLFCPVPMTMRTWIYHHLFRQNFQTSGDDGPNENAMIEYVLGMHCIDDQARAGGKFSPILLHAPMIFVLSLAADINATIVAVIMLALNISITRLLNTPRFYRICRIVTFPGRLAFIFWLLARMGASGEKENASMMMTLGFLVAIFFCIAEIVAGDIGSLIAYRLHCSYEVIKVLPNRIFICRRHGAAHSQDTASRLQISEKITGMGFWQDDLALIADVKGLIVELQPMGIKEWETIFVEKQENEDMVHRYIGLDVFSPGQATIDALMAANEENQMLAQKNAKQQQFNKDMHVVDA